MSSVWIVVSNAHGPLIEDGFHVTEEAAVARAEAKGLEDRAAYEQAKQWLEVSLEEFRAIRDLPSRYAVQEVEDTEYEIHRDGVVPDAVWLLLEEGEVDAERGYRVTRASAEDLLLARDIAAHEYWEDSIERHEEDQSFVEFHRDGWNNHIVRVQRHDLRLLTERPSVRALELKERVMSGAAVPEPMMSVRDGLTTFTWEGGDGALVELRSDGSGTASTTVHRDGQRPCVTTHRDDIVMRARQAMGILPIHPHRSSEETLEESDI